MRIYGKSELEFFKGYITDGNRNVIGLPAFIYEDLQMIEEFLQRSLWKEENETTPIEAIDPFKLESAFEKKRYTKDKLPTPLLDERTQLSLYIESELSKNMDIDRFNTVVSRFQRLMEWLDDDVVLHIPGGICKRFDLPMLGNPLGLTSKDVLDVLDKLDEVEA